MLSAQSIYGPHASGQWDDGDVSLGRRLFRLLPEDAFDDQPIAGEGGRFTLVADVRLDNRDDLEAALNIHADRARRLCDAALLLAVWEQWGEDSFDRLVGCYAFALWDRRHSALTLARDALGQRPLHYHRGANFFAFASMPKGLHALEEVPRAPDEARAQDFLASIPDVGTQSFFAGVARVEPGSFVTVTADGLQSRRHWPPRRQPIILASPNEYEEAIRAHLDQAVGSQLRGANGAVGAHLSGGLDSSAVTATAARLTAMQNGRVTAFTSVPRAGYAGASPDWCMNNEGPLAAIVAAQHPNVEHVLVRPTGRLQTEMLDRDTFLYDRPMLNPWIDDWWHEINRLARDRGLSIILTGAYGNMSLTHSGLDALPEHLGRGRLAAWLRLAARVTRAGTMRWRGALFYSLGPWMPGVLWNALSRMRGGYFEDVRRWSALNPALLSPHNRAQRLRDLGFDPWYRPSADSFTWRVANMLDGDVGNLNKGALGGWGVDLRDPTGDRRLVEFCLNIPTEQFMFDGVPRALARQALADRLPAEVLQETRRGYQAADWHEAATAGRAELADQVERLQEFPMAVTTLDLARLRRLVEDWPSEGWERFEVAEPYQIALLRGLALGRFLRVASGSNL
jgi:asparagine synthase (glutamine-hydrolysing)